MVGSMATQIHGILLRVKKKHFAAVIVASASATPTAFLAMLDASIKRKFSDVRDVTCASVHPAT